MAKYHEKLGTFLTRATELQIQAEKDEVKERAMRRELKEAREAAEKDTANIKKLTGLFADCLVRAKLPGFSQNDAVKMEAPWFLPEVISVAGDIATVSFDTLGSGGIKTLFKACFAVALHRLAAATGADLPKLLIIDSPMKNISERENRAQFEGFHAMLYEIGMSELRETQFILIDKEFCPPAKPFNRILKDRHMRVDSEEFPPLIPYYRATTGR